jgi:hypothetical protein
MLSTAFAAAEETAMADDVSVTILSSNLVCGNSV